MRIDEVIQLYRHYPEGYVSDDTELSDFAIYNQLIISRARIYKDRKSLENFTEASFQTLLCIEFKEVDKSECNIDLPSNCRVLKSTCAIPNSLQVKSITTRLGNEKLDFIQWDRLEGKLNSSIPSIRKGRYSAIRNLPEGQFIYIINDLDLKQATLTAIFEDPVKAAAFCGGNDVATCDPLRLDFFTDLAYLEPILKLTWDTTLRLRNTAGPDLKNNDRKDT